MSTSTKTLSPITVSVADAIELTGISRTKLYQALRSGELRSLKVGGRRLFRLLDLESWLSAHVDNHV